MGKSVMASLGFGCVDACDSVNTLYILVEETDIVSTSVKVLC